MANIGYIQILRICNQSCLFCSNPDNGRIMSVAEVKKNIDDLVARKYVGIILTGGEPTMHSGLAELIAYIAEQGLEPKIITNGSQIANEKYLETLMEAGLKNIHISLFSHKKEIQNLIINNNTNGYIKVIKALKNLAKYQGKISVSVNCVINKYNADHLHEIMMFICKNFPVVNHIIINNMDPLMIRETNKHLRLWAELPNFEKSLAKASLILQGFNKTFRVEKVPLCYMKGFEHLSTETRKIVQNEERIVHFLDERSFYQQLDWKYSVPKVCIQCDLFDLCAGLFHEDEFYNTNDLKPVKLGEKYKQAIINRVLANP